MASSRWRQARKQLPTAVEEQSSNDSSIDPWEETEKLKKEYLRMDVLLRENVPATAQEGLDYDPKYPGTVVDVANPSDIRLKIFGPKRRFSSAILIKIKELANSVHSARAAAFSASSEVKTLLEQPSIDLAGLKKAVQALSEKVRLYVQERDGAVAESRALAAGIERGPCALVPEPSNPEVGCLWFVDLVNAYRRERDLHPTDPVSHQDLYLLLQSSLGLGLLLQESFANAKSNMSAFMEQNNAVLRRHNIVPE